MALVEEHALRYRAEMEDTLAETTTIAQNREAFKQLCLKIARDKAWNILTLEFKLFAIRNPSARKRFQEFLSPMLSPDDEMRLSQLLGVERIGRQALRRTVSVRIIQPLMSAVALEHLFDPGSVDEKTIERVNLRLFEAIIGEPSPPEHPSAQAARQGSDAVKAMPTASDGVTATAHCSS